MAIGDDALAAGMAIVDGNSTLANTLDTEINKSRDYIAQRTSTVTPVAKGGTGATSAAAALTNLGALPRAEVFDGAGSVFNKVPRYDAAGRLIVATPAEQNHAVPLGTINSFFANYIPRWGGSIDQGHLYLPIATPATSSYAVAYINGDGRVSKGASSERYKKYISVIDPSSLGDIWPDLVRYQMKGGDGSWKYGYIAERLDEAEDLRAFVVYDDEHRPDSIDFIALLMAQNAQLHDRLTALEIERE